MDACPLDQLHDTGDKYLLAVTDRVHFQFLTGNIPVHQDRPVLVDLNGRLQVAAHLLLPGYDLHGSAAKDKAGPYQHRISDGFGSLYPILDAGHGHAPGLRDTKFMQEFFKKIPVLRPVDGFTAGADQPYAPLMQGLCQVDGSLAAQGDDHAHGLFQFNDIHHVFRTQGLKIQLVGRGIVRRDSFGVIIDNDCFISFFFNGPNCVHGGIVKFHALTDPDGSGSQHDHTGPFRNNRFVLSFIGGIKIGHIAFKFGSAGIDHLVDRKYPFLFAQSEDLLLQHLPEGSNGGV